MTSDALFKDFVQRQQRVAPADTMVDWKKERDAWLAHLQDLYDIVAACLSQYIQDGTITLRESTIELNEENIGAYSATRLVIVIGAQEILLTPVGTLLIGSKGRVDVEGSAGGSRLVLVDKHFNDPRQKRPTSEPEIEWTWKIVSRPPAMQFIELNKDSLFEMLIEVSNG